MKAFIKVSFVLLALLATQLVYAQRGDRDMDPEARAERQTESMKERLSLTDDQLPIIKSINLKYAQKMKEARDGAEGDWESMRGTMKALNEQKKVELKAVLTEEQFKALEAWEEERRTNRQNSKGKRDKDKGSDEGEG